MPFAQWWSSALVGPGTQPLWAHPIAAQVTPVGEVDFSNKTPTQNADGTTISAFEPVLTASNGGGATTVTGWGHFHVTLEIGSAPKGLELTLVQGSPFAEIASLDGSLQLRGQQLSVDSSDDRTVRLTTGGQRWVVSADQPVSWTAGDDSLSVESLNQRDATATAPPTTGLPGSSAVQVRPLRLALGPEPTEASIDWGAEARLVAEAPLISTDETTITRASGQVTQVLKVRRTKELASLWSLLPHQQQLLEEPTDILGRVNDAMGSLPVQRHQTLTLEYPATPLLWSAIDSSGGVPVDLLKADLENGSGEGGGSYFGGKSVGYNATLADLGASAESSELRDLALARIKNEFDQLAVGEGAGIAWEPTWGTLIMTPAQFGLGAELNDHHLQYGYWVMAASIVAEHDRAWGKQVEPFVEALIADYSGDDLVECRTGLAARRTWGAFVGHSYASGTAPFTDGNNLESTSEAIASWWAAARWFTTMGRADLAEPFIARYTIESYRARTAWLDLGHSDPALRPWVGIRWSAKSDLGTWFDPAPESALGIQLLPLGPSSLNRYGDAEALAQAQRRWAWCRDFGAGCRTRWVNLLSSDAHVGGDISYPTTGSDDEPSTSRSVLHWWSNVWSSSTIAPLSCSPGVIARQSPSGAVSVWATNPSPTPTTARCFREGTEIWSAPLGAGATLRTELR